MAMMRHPELPPGALPLLGEAERQQLLTEWNDSATPLPDGTDRALHELFMAAARGLPEAPALLWEDVWLTYGELDRRSNRLAWHLRRLGVVPEARVALAMERSPEMIVGLLGILKAGGAYVPIDPGHPGDRLTAMLEDLAGEDGPVAVLTMERMAPRFSGHRGPVLRLDVDWPAIIGVEEEAPASGVSPSNALYVLFTSGSSGRPKGVIVEHRQAVNYLRAIEARLDLVSGATFAMVQPLTVDSCKTVVFPSLLLGGLLHLIPEGQVLDRQALVESFQRHPVDVLKIAPSHLGALLGSPPLSALLPRGRLVLGGEASRRDWAVGLGGIVDGCRVFNHYGPTEATVGMLVCSVIADLPTGPSLTTPLGRPLANTGAHVLDREMKLVPLGVHGELFVAGDCLARGYLGRTDLTAERFVPDPHAQEPGDRLYRTGDLVRRLPDGTIEFLGRIDHQVKIRGFRIELGEIEAALCRHPQVREGVVAVHDPGTGSAVLVAYVVPEGEVSTGGLQVFLEGKLPAYMVPADYVVLEDLPRTPHGKVLRQALPAPDRARARQPGQLLSPGVQSELEEIVAVTVAEILQLERVGREESFFDLGGHSLLAMRLIARLSQTCGVELPVRAVFEHPVVAGLAQVVEEALRAGAAVPAPPIEWAPRDGRLPLSFAQQRLWFLDRLEPESAVYNIPTAVVLEGPLDVGVLAASLAAVVARHESLRTTFGEVEGE
ncbi:MAG TPA: amino acid adenylation domain-containing protein, partial [Thermoanaerobaculia bacterium]|nr:amino acid adenylation domain-containing protein [Thermoanaerobaculia bacterium]